MSKEDHKLRMNAKKVLRANMYARFSEPHAYIPANLSKHHPDYGMSMKDHEAEKAARNAQKSS